MKDWLITREIYFSFLNVKWSQSIYLFLRINALSGENNFVHASHRWSTWPLNTLKIKKLKHPFSSQPSQTFPSHQYLPSCIYPLLIVSYSNTFAIDDHKHVFEHRSPLTVSRGCRARSIHLEEIELSSNQAKAHAPHACALVLAGQVPLRVVKSSLAPVSRVSSRQCIRMNHLAEGCFIMQIRAVSREPR